jgi:polyhydroxyalkanoate synthase
MTALPAAAQSVTGSANAHSATVAAFPRSAVACTAPAAVPTKDAADRDSYAVTALADITDRSLHAGIARFTAGLSPAALAHAYWDWATHLVYAPGKRLQLVDKAIRKALRFANYGVRSAMGAEKAPCCIEPLPQDKRFAAGDWQQWPYNFLYQGFLLQQQWWHNATTGIRGLSRRHEDMVEFASRQILDTISPSNFPMTNPEVLRHTFSNGGMNLINGFQNLMEDWERSISGKKPIGTENFVVGRDVAVTPGKVIYRNRLIELIQYAPATDKVRPQPLGCPADREIHAADGTRQYCLRSDHLRRVDIHFPGRRDVVSNWMVYRVAADGAADGLLDPHPPCIV